MDGVPGLSFNGIHRGEAYHYRFHVQPGRHLLVPQPLRRSRNRPACTAPIVDRSARAGALRYDRDYVVLLSDWTDWSRRALFARLKKMSDYYNFHKRTVGDFVRDVQQQRPRRDRWPTAACGAGCG